MAESSGINSKSARYSKEFIDNLDKNLLFAYRKVKVDLFYSSIPARRNLIEYEENLPDNLAKLKEALLNKKLTEYLNSDNKAFGYFLIPKKINYKDSVTDKNKNIFYFDPKKRYESRKVSSYDFRLLADVSIDFHVITTLWIICVGEKLEKNLSDSVYANRIRRTYDKKKKINLNSLGTFGPYNHAYKSWRDNALNTIKQELEHKQDVVAITGDIKGFYHCLSPKIILRDEFYKFLKGKSHQKTVKNLTKDERNLTDDKKYLTNDEQHLTEDIVNDVLLPWSKQTPLEKGLPVGCSISAVIANLALIQFDDVIEKELKPCYYGRYVDDIILVLENSDNKFSHNSNDIWESIINRCNRCLFRNKDISSDKKNDHIYINLLANCDFILEQPIKSEPSNNDTLVMEESKTKFFIFDSTCDLDSIKVLEHQIQEQASEWRSIPDIDNIENTLTKIISLDDEAGEQADNLLINNVSQKRNSFSIALRNIQFFIRNVDISLSSNKDYFNVFWETIEKHYLNITSFFDYFEFFPRIISIVFSLKEYSKGFKFVNFFLESFTQLYDENREKCKIALGRKKSFVKVDFDALGKYIVKILRESVECSLYGVPKNEFEALFYKNVKSELKDYLHINTDLFKEYYKRDLAYWSQRHLFFSDDLTPPGSKDLKDFINENNYEYLVDKRYLLCYDINTRKELYAFYKKLKTSDDIEQSIESSIDREVQIPISWIFPTRSFDFEELLLICPQFYKISSIFKKILLFFRGEIIKGDYWEIETYTGKDGSPHSIVNVFKGNEKPGKVTVALVSWETTFDDWNEAVKGTRTFSTERIDQLTRLINQVIYSKTENKINIDYLIFPELSLPSEYFNEINKQLKKRNISLIAGLEYIHVPFDKNDYVIDRTRFTNYVINQVRCSLISWPKSVKGKSYFKHFSPICQNKTRPAQGEEKELADRKKIMLTKKEKDRLYAGDIIQHGAFSFGILICSELTNIDYRAMLRGKVDSIIIPEFNDGVDQFSSIVESAAYDLHAYIVQCNNRLYGDTRVRYPAKIYYMRDLAKVKGSIEDFYIITKLDIKKLREFQSGIIHNKVKLGANGHIITTIMKFLNDINQDDFKPIPDGFEIDDTRKM